MTDKARILLITSSYPSPLADGRAAAGIFVQDFAEELASQADVTVLTQMTEPGAAVTSTEGPLEVVRFPWRGQGKPLSTLSLPGDIGPVISVLFGSCRYGSNLIKRKKYDLVFALWAVPSGLTALYLKWRFGLPYAVWALGADIWDYGKKPVLKNIVRLILGRARARFADGFKLKDDVEDLSGLDCAFIPSTRSLSLDRPAKAELVLSRKNYLFIGRFHPAKGPDVLLEAISLLPGEVRDRVYFHLFGGGPLESDLAKTIEEKNLSDCVSLNGYIQEERAVAFLTSCNALIIPSRIESIPVVLSDGLQTDCPLIVSDVGDMGDLMRKYEAGRVVKPESPEELKEAILNDYTEGASGFSEGFEELKSLFDLKIAVNALLEKVPSST